MNWMGGRAVEGTGLENRRGCELSVSSNLTPSATFTVVRNVTVWHHGLFKSLR